MFATIISTFPIRIPSPTPISPVRSIDVRMIVLPCSTSRVPLNICSVPVTLYAFSPWAEGPGCGTVIVSVYMSCGKTTSKRSVRPGTFV